MGCSTSRFHDSIDQSAFARLDDSVHNMIKQEVVKAIKEGRRPSVYRQGQTVEVLSQFLESDHYSNVTLTSHCESETTSSSSGDEL